MDRTKYIGMDVHQASTSIAVRDASGKLVMESLIETKAATILEFLQGLKGTLCVTFEEGTSAAWLYDLLKPHVANVVVCDPRKVGCLAAGRRVATAVPWPKRTGWPGSRAQLPRWAAHDLRRSRCRSRLFNTGAAVEGEAQLLGQRVDGAGDDGDRVEMPVAAQHPFAGA